MTKGRKDFDLPTRHLQEGVDYVPPRARDAAEAERRRRLPAGTLVLEQQATGLDVASAIYNYPVDNAEDQNFINRRTASALMNAAWYIYANDSPEVMRRRLKLPELADDEAEWRETRSGLMIKVRNGLNHAASLGHRLAIAHQKEFNTKRIERQLGRQMGTTALAIAALPLGNAPKGMSEIEIQDIVMWTSMDLLESSRFSHEINGVHASIAQLADPQSPLSIAWKHNAPSTNQAHDALIQAQSDFGNPG